jgi:hypothetical protein
MVLSERPSCMEVYSLYRKTYPNQNFKTVIVANPHACQKMQCKKCFDVKMTKHRRRLESYRIRTKRIIHCTAGIKVDSKDKILGAKKELEKIFRKFTPKLRKRGFLFRYLRVFDLAHNKKDGTWFAHFHFGVIPEGRKLNSTNLNNLISRVSNNRVQVFKIIGYKSKKNVFGYFAKRMSGYFGHKKHGDNFFLEEVMTWEEADNIFLHMRKLVVSAPSEARLSSNKGNIALREHDKNYSIIERLGISFTIKTKIPPPNGWDTLDLAMKYVLEQDLFPVGWEGADLIKQYENKSSWELSMNTRLSVGSQSSFETDNFFVGGSGYPEDDYFNDPRLFDPSLTPQVPS